MLKETQRKKGDCVVRATGNTDQLGPIVAIAVIDKPQQSFNSNSFYWPTSNDIIQNYYGNELRDPVQELNVLDSYALQKI